MINLSEPPACLIYVKGALNTPGIYKYKTNDRWALHLFLGEGNLVIGREERTIKPGLLSITPAGVESVYNIDKPLSYICCHFRTAAGPGHRLIDPFNNTISQDMAQRVSDGIDLYAADTLQGTALLWQVLLAISREADSSEPLHPCLKKALVIINRELSPRLTLERLSDGVHISSTHLNRLFKDRYEITVYQYIIQERMKRIKYFITQTNIPLKQIALEAGYNDLQQFNKHCRHYLGRSPREMRISS